MLVEMLDAEEVRGHIEVILDAMDHAKKALAIGDRAQAHGFMAGAWAALEVLVKEPEEPFPEEMADENPCPRCDGVAIVRTVQLIACRSCGHTERQW